MPTFGNIDLEEPSTVTASVSAVQFTRNSSVELQEIVSLGDPDTTNGLAAILNATPASTAWGLVTRPYGASTQRFVPATSTGGFLTTNTDPGSTADAVVVRQVGWSTRISLSSVGGLVKLPSTQTINARSSAADALVTVYQSTITDLLAQVDQNSTVWVTQCSSLGGLVKLPTTQTINVNSSAADALVTVYQSTITECDEVLS